MAKLRNKLTGNVFTTKHPVAVYFGSANRTSDGTPIFERSRKRKVTRVKKNPATRHAFYQELGKYLRAKELASKETFGKRKRVADASIRKNFIIELLHKDYGIWYASAAGKTTKNILAARYFSEKPTAEFNMKEFLAAMPHSIKKNFVWIRVRPA